MLEYLSDLRLFAEACRTLNFRKAGEKFGYAPSIVSMRIKRLEQVTGKTLFIRSTRHISLTDDGREMLEMAQKMIEIAALMTDRQGQSVLQGSVRITAPHSFSQRFLLQPMQQMMLEQPELKVDLFPEDNLTNLIKEGIDICIRAGTIESLPNAHIEELAIDNRIVLASPDYVEKYGTPQHPDDLQHHNCLTYPGITHWTLYTGKQQKRIPVTGTLTCSTGDYLTKAALAGLGITIKSEWSVREEIKEQKLLHILPDYTASKDNKIYALLPGRKTIIPPRIRYVLDLMIASIHKQL